MDLLLRDTCQNYLHGEYIYKFSQRQNKNCSRKEIFLFKYLELSLRDAKKKNDKCKSSNRIAAVRKRTENGKSRKQWGKKGFRKTGNHKLRR